MSASDIIDVAVWSNQSWSESRMVGQWTTDLFLMSRRSILSTRWLKMITSDHWSSVDIIDITRILLAAVSCGSHGIECCSVNDNHALHCEVSLVTETSKSLTDSPMLWNPRQLISLEYEDRSFIRWTLKQARRRQQLKKHLPHHRTIKTTSAYI